MLKGKEIVEGGGEEKMWGSEFWGVEGGGDEVVGEGRK